ncbi:MAG TPA: DUF4123 domain-containing protein [Polyangiaceae bacterium]|nr:DUF4123 domain-containing protein [Polyangiaceae bacterium]
MNLRRALQSQGQPLYALLDAGRDPEVLTLLYRYESPCRSLYQGESEATLGPSGPYLVELRESERESELVTQLLRKGWGQSWGVFVVSAAQFDELRRHFRTLLMVRRAKDQSELYFRFYDPRVLRVFLPTCSPEQVRAVFGPVTAFLMEDAEGSLLRCVADLGKVACEVVAHA